MDSIPVGKLDDARCKVLANASKLVEEAQFLLEGEYYARAYALAHLASEELFKLPMLLRAGASALVGADVDWTKLKKGLTSHRSKLRGILLIDFLHDRDTEGDADVERLRQDLLRIPRYNDLKNWSLYTSYIKEEFVEPAELISRTLSSVMVKLAKNRLAFFVEIEGILGNALEKMRNHPELLSKVEDEIRRLEEAFYPKHERRAEHKKTTG